MFLTDKLRVLPDIFQTATLIVAKTHKGKWLQELVVK
jgi:hypothetical protein